MKFFSPADELQNPFLFFVSLQRRKKVFSPADDLQTPCKVSWRKGAGGGHMKEGCLEKQGSAMVMKRGGGYNSRERR